MPAGRFDITVEQGSTFNLQLAYKTPAGTPVNLTNFTARMQIRADYCSSNWVANCTTENGGIVLGGSAGTIVVSIPATTTEWIEAGQYVYDLELVSGSAVTRLIEGRATVTSEVTR